ncbi:GMC family oxidoreductase [Phenylobacterium sp.]|uniref:GMC family oxidoreductase n=1 Tax=Phenylobacterium sp. TaxID=1871053 RepID=UPI002F41D43D
MAGALEFDHIVVGAGAAGCVLAARLAEQGRKVLLLEAGPRDRSPLLSIPGASAFGAAARRFNWSYESEPQPELGGRRLYLSQGRVLGGGSSINGMVYTRGFPHDYDAWRDAGCAGWGFADLLPYFRCSEANERGEDAWHGGSGPLAVTKGRSSLGICERILQAADQAGYPRVEDFARPGDGGFGWYDFTISNGRRVSSAAAFLRRSDGVAGPTVIAGAQAARVLTENGRASGVAFALDGVMQTAHATGEVILCAGAINSAKLLMLSGIGPGDHLRALGVPVVLDQPQVGRNYQNHLAYKLAWATCAPITGYRYLNPFTGGLEAMRYLADHTGFLSEGSSPVGGFFRSDQALAHPDLQLFSPPVMVGLLGRGLRALLPSQHGFSFFVNQGRPASRGFVTLRSADPREAPVIEPRYLSEPSDLEALVSGTERLRDIAARPALAEVISREIRPGPEARTRAEIAASIRRLASNHFHVAGTCRMGPDGASSVVDPQLRVHGLPGLRVADASIMPELVNGNLGAPVMMIAEKAAAMIGGA